MPCCRALGSGPTALGQHCEEGVWTRPIEHLQWVWRCSCCAHWMAEAKGTRMTLRTDYVLVATVLAGDAAGNATAFTLAAGHCGVPPGWGECVEHAGGLGPEAAPKGAGVLCINQLLHYLHPAKRTLCYPSLTCRQSTDHPSLGSTGRSARHLCCRAQGGKPKGHCGRWAGRGEG